MTKQASGQEVIFCPSSWRMSWTTFPLPLLFRNSRESAIPGQKTTSPYELAPQVEGTGQNHSSFRDSLCSSFSLSCHGKHSPVVPSLRIVPVGIQLSPIGGKFFKNQFQASWAGWWKPLPQHPGSSRPWSRGDKSVSLPQPLWKAFWHPWPALFLALQKEGRSGSGREDVVFRLSQNVLDDVKPHCRLLPSLSACFCDIQFQ